MSILGTIALVCLCIVVFLMISLSSKLRLLSTAKIDNIAWSSAQLEVEFLDLVNEATIAQTRKGLNDFDPLRKKFNISYSRVDTLVSSKSYQQILNSSEFSDELADLMNRLDRLVPLIDGDDLTLSNQLLTLTDELTNLRPLVRKLSIDANLSYTASANKTRNELTVLLLQFGAFSIVLLGALLWLMGLLWRLYHLNKRRAIDNLATTQRLSAIIETSQDAILVLDQTGATIDCNSAAVSMFGVQKSYLKTHGIAGRLWRPRTDGSHQPVSIEELFEACQTGPRNCRHLSAMNASAARFPVELSMGLATHRTEPLLVCFLRDITIQLQAEQSIKDARDRALANERTKARFLAVMSHEMRTPLNGVLGAIDLLKTSKLTRKQDDYLNVMLRSGQILQQHVNDVLDIARFEDVGLTLKEEPFDLEALIFDLVETEAPKATAKATALTFHAPSAPLATMLGDPHRFRQIILNLVSNAIKFTQNGEIGIEISQNPLPVPNLVQVEIQITDTGAGIPTDQQNRIFEDYVRLENHESAKTEGTGLGLGIARSLVTAMGGEIGVESEIGSGSLFWVRIPLRQADKPLNSKKTTLHAESTVRPLEILLVEDNPTNRFITAEMLRRDMHSVTQAENGEIGLKTAIDKYFDVILMDINMPVMNGLEATEKLRRSKGKSAKTHIIALTAHMFDGNESHVLEAGFDSIITKPLRWETLRASISAPLPPAKHPKSAIPGNPKTIDLDVLSGLKQTLTTVQTKALFDQFLLEGDQFATTYVHLNGSTPADVQTATHQFAGSAATFGATHLWRALSSVENTAKSGSEDEITEALHRILPVWKRTRAALQLHRNML